MTAPDAPAPPARVIVTSADDIAQQVDRRLSRAVSLGWMAVVVALHARNVSELAGFPQWWLVITAVAVSLVLVNIVWGARMPFRALIAIWIVVPCLGAWRVLLSAITGEENLLSGWIVSSEFVFYVVFWLRPLAAVLAVALVAMLPLLQSVLVMGEPATTDWRRLPLAAMTLVLVVMVLTARRLMMEFALAEAAARRREEARIVAMARADQQQRFQRLVHDEVLSTLVAALRLDGDPPDVLRRQADSALVALSGYAFGESGDLPCAQIERRLTEIVRLEDPAAEVRTYTSAGVVPGRVVDTILGATAEAVRNSAKHAGADANRTVRAVIAPRHIRIDVTDDGVGFDRAVVGADRLGLRGSIIGAMATIESATCEVRSAPGGGTSIVLEWTR